MNLCEETLESGGRGEGGKRGGNNLKKLENSV